MKENEHWKSKKTLENNWATKDFYRLKEKVIYITKFSVDENVISLSSFLCMFKVLCFKLIFKFQEIKLIYTAKILIMQCTTNI